MKPFFAKYGGDWNYTCDRFKYRYGYNSMDDMALAFAGFYGPELYLVERQFREFAFYHQDRELTPEERQQVHDRVRWHLQAWTK